MATYHLHGYHVTWHPATKTRSAYARVWLNGRRPHLLKTVIHHETISIPLEPNYKTDEKAVKDVVKRAMKMSDNDWKVGWGSGLL